MNSPNPPRKVLGRGLDALLNPGIPAAAQAPVTAATALAPDPNYIRPIPLDQIEANPFQPRQAFPSEALEELAESIRSQGVLQPILVRPRDGRWQLIAGERRFRAARMAGLAAIPAIVKAIPDDRALEIALIENIQREDLNPIEQARALQQLATRFQMPQEHLAQRTGKDRASVANLLRLLKLDVSVQDLVEAGALSMGHARALLSLPSSEQKPMADRALASGWSVRRMEAAVRSRLEPNPAKPKIPLDPNIRDAEEQLCHALGTKVEIRDSHNRGSITLAYHGVNDFQRLFDHLMAPKR